ncbi:hypothetical protein GWK47_032887 [Chionoecetes opilio]|uniref:DDE Tnp4 domain-containing protein n=1 Tax=Chionoecetes opilio TaxID=41210 RepID=A0A8J4YPY2_CHIOP|nr:hypothetical protein GWK47_032887 [Chionoecetes opilio]
MPVLLSPSITSGYDFKLKLCVLFLNLQLTVRCISSWLSCRTSPAKTAAFCRPLHSSLHPLLPQAASSNGNPDFFSAPVSNRTLQHWCLLLGLGKVAQCHPGTLHGGAIDGQATADTEAPDLKTLLSVGEDTLAFTIALEDGCRLPMIGISVKEVHDEWDDQLDSVLQQSGRYFEVPVAGPLSEAAMKRIGRHARREGLARKDIIISTSIAVPEDAGAGVALVKAFLDHFTTHIELLYIENPVGLKGESRRSLEFQYRISHNLISSIIPEVCDALFAVLRGTYLKLPTTSAEWQEVASGFSNVWQFPNCIGALDGKRFLVIKPDNTGAEYFDYKSHHSVIMLALVDASYKFLYIDVGAQGRASDAGVWDKCNLKKYIEDKKLQPDTLIHSPNSPGHSHTLSQQSWTLSYTLPTAPDTLIHSPTAPDTLIHSPNSPGHLDTLSNSPDTRIHSPNSPDTLIHSPTVLDTLIHSPTVLDTPYTLPTVRTLSYTPNSPGHPHTLSQQSWTLSYTLPTVPDTPHTLSQQSWTLIIHSPTVLDTRILSPNSPDTRIHSPNSPGHSHTLSQQSGHSHTLSQQSGHPIHSPNSLDTHTLSQQSWTLSYTLPTVLDTHTLSQQSWTLSYTLQQSWTLHTLSQQSWTPSYTLPTVLDTPYTLPTVLDTLIHSPNSPGHPHTLSQQSWTLSYTLPTVLDTLIHSPNSPGHPHTLSQQSWTLSYTLPTVLDTLIHSPNSPGHSHTLSQQSWTLSYTLPTVLDTRIHSPNSPGHSIHSPNSLDTLIHSPNSPGHSHTLSQQSWTPSYTLPTVLDTAYTLPTVLTLSYTLPTVLGHSSYTLPTVLDTLIHLPTVLDTLIHSPNSPGHSHTLSQQSWTPHTLSNSPGHSHTNSPTVLDTRIHSPNSPGHTHTLSNSPGHSHYTLPTVLDTRIHSPNSPGHSHTLSQQSWTLSSHSPNSPGHSHTLSQQSWTPHTLSNSPGHSHTLSQQSWTLSYTLPTVLDTLIHSPNSPGHSHTLSQQSWTLAYTLPTVPDTLIHSPTVLDTLIHSPNSPGHSYTLPTVRTSTPLLTSLHSPTVLDT